MMNRIEQLSEVKLLFVYNRLKENLIDRFGLNDMLYFNFKRREVDFQHARQILNKLATEQDTEWKALIEQAITEAEGLPDNGKQTTFSEEAYITITGMILAYLLLNKILNYTLPALQVYLLRQAGSDQKFEQQIQQLSGTIDDRHVANTRVVILTPIKEEFQAVYRQMEKHSELNEHEEADGTIYIHGRFPARHQLYDIYLRRTESGLQSTATFTSQAIVDLNPDILLLVGIAGSLRPRFKVGDIIVGTVAYEYQSGSVEHGKDFYRPRDTRHYTERWIERAKVMVNNTDWKKRIDYGGHSFPADMSRKAESDVAPIVAGDKTIYDDKSPLRQFIRKHCGDAGAAEKEATGIVNATRRNPGIEVANIRSISDIVGQKAETDQLGYKIMAASHASAFAFEMLDHIKKKA